VHTHTHTHTHRETPTGVFEVAAQTLATGINGDHTHTHTASLKFVGRGGRARDGEMK